MREDLVLFGKLSISNETDMINSTEIDSESIITDTIHIKKKIHQYRDLRNENAKTNIKRITAPRTP